MKTNDKSTDDREGHGKYHCNQYKLTFQGEAITYIPKLKIQ